MLEAFRRLRVDLERVGKPKEVEGVLDRWLIRPSGYLVARWLTPSWLGPNSLSLLALAFGWFTAYALYWAARLESPPSYAYLALIGMWLHSAFDSADGQLARSRGVATEFGRVLDGICDYLTFAAIYLAIGAGLAQGSAAGGVGYLALAVAGGLSHALQCAVVEFQRNLYRHYVYDTELPFDPSELATTPTESEGFGWGTLHLAYSRIQSLFGGSSLALWRVIAPRIRELGEDREQVVGLIVAEYRPRLPVWALLAPNSHKVGMIVGAFLPLGGGRLLGSPGLLWYLIYVVLILNLLLLAMILTQTHTDRRIRSLLDQQGEESVSGDSAGVAHRS